MDIKFGGSHMWHYKAIDEDGDEVEGAVFADGIEDAIAAFSVAELDWELIGLLRGEPVEDMKVSTEIRDLLVGKMAEEETKH